jgi:hypothetical protein
MLLIVLFRYDEQHQAMFVTVLVLVRTSDNVVAADDGPPTGHCGCILVGREANGNRVLQEVEHCLFPPI